MVQGLAQRPSGPRALRGVCTVMAGLAGRRDDRSVVGHRVDEAGLAGVASIAFDPSGNWNMGCRLAFGRGAVMAGVTGSRTHCICRGMGVADDQPAARGLVATLAVAGDRAVNSRSGLACNTIRGCQMAGGALGGHRHIPVELSRPPAKVTPFVASVAIADDYPGNRRVGNVVGCLAIRRRIRTGMAGGALVDHRHLGMVPGAGLPHGQGRAVATHTVRCGREVGSVFAGGRGAVMACRAHRGGCVGTVVRFGSQPRRCIGVATLAVAGDRGVDGRCGLGRHTVSRCQMASRTLRGDSHIGMEAPRVPGGIASLVAGVTVADGDACERLVGNVVGCLAIRRRMRSVVTSIAGIGNDGLGVIPARGLP